MWYEDPAVAAVGVTLASAVVVCGVLHAPLTAVLIGYAGHKARGRFWAAFAEVTLVLVPVCLILVLAPIPESPQSFSLPATAAILKWGVIGLVGSVFALAAMIGLFGRLHGASVYIDPDQFDDLNRLLTKVRELRARELLDQLDREPAHAAR